MTAPRTICAECHGSRLRMGADGDVPCPDCDALGSWDDEPESCRLCGTVLIDCECPRCDSHLTETHPLLKVKRA